MRASPLLNLLSQQKEVDEVTKKALIQPCTSSRGPFCRGKEHRNPQQPSNWPAQQWEPLTFKNTAHCQQSTCCPPFCHQKDFLLQTNWFNNGITTVWRWEAFAWQNTEEWQVRSHQPVHGPGGCFFPTLFSCSIYCADVPEHLYKCFLTCQTVWVLFENTPFVEGYGFSQKNRHKVRLVSQLSCRGSTQPLDHTGGLTPLLFASSHYPGCTKLKQLHIKMSLQFFQNCMKGFFTVYPKGVGPNTYTSISKHRAQHLFLPYW